MVTEIWQKFISNLTNQTLVLKFTCLTQYIIETLINALKVDAEKGKLALQSINNFCEAYPKLWKENLEFLIETTCQILQEPSFDESIKESTLQIILTMVSKTPAFMRKSEKFNKVFLPLIFSMMLDVNSIKNVDEWNQLVILFVLTFSLMKTKENAKKCTLAQLRESKDLL
jgi:hypothetical protein